MLTYRIWLAQEFFGVNFINENFPRKLYDMHPWLLFIHVADFHITSLTSILKVYVCYSFYTLGTAWPVKSLACAQPRRYKVLHYSTHKFFLLLRRDRQKCFFFLFRSLCCFVLFLFIFVFRNVYLFFGNNICAMRWN